jgi:hypothetical protein
VERRSTHYDLGMDDEIKALIYTSMYSNPYNISSLTLQNPAVTIYATFFNNP